MPISGLYVKPRRNSRKAKHKKAYREVEALLSTCGLFLQAEQRILNGCAIFIEILIFAPNIPITLQIFARYFNTCIDKVNIQTLLKYF